MTPLGDRRALAAACASVFLWTTAALAQPSAEPDEREIIHEIVRTLVGYMDAEVAARLSEPDLDALGAACGTQGEAWGACVDANPDDDDACDEEEDAVASCLVGDDRVSGLYLDVQAEKKAVFGAELYVEIRGVLSILTMAELNALRDACPQTAESEVLECLAGQPKVDDVLTAFAEISAGAVAEVNKAMGDSDMTLTEAQATAAEERLMNLLLTLPLQVVNSLAGTCAAKMDADAPESAAALDAMLSCMDQSSDEDPVANPAYISAAKLKSWLEIARSKVVQSIRAKETDKQARSLWLVLIMLGAVLLVGLLFILTQPLRLAGKHPEQEGLLWKASAVGAATFAGTMVLLGVTLVAMRLVQGAVATDSTSPKMRVAEAVFDVLERDDYLEGLSDLSKERLDFIRTPLRAVVQATAEDETEAARYAVFAAHVAEHWSNLLNEPELRHLAKNIELLKGHAESFKSVLGFYRSIDWALGYVPMLMALLAVFLYLLPMRSTLVTLTTAPARAAASGDASGIAGQGGRMAWAEIKLLGPFLLSVLIFLPLTGLFIAYAVEPLVELLLNFSLLTVFYVLFNEASGFVLYASLGSSVLLLASAIIVYVLALVFLLGALRKIFRRRFHDGQPLGAHARFWRWGLLAVLGVLAYPVLHATLTMSVAEPVLDSLEIDGLGAMQMLAVPLGSLVAFPLLFWLLRGTKALAFIKGYTPAEPG